VPDFTATESTHALGSRSIIDGGTRNKGHQDIKCPVDRQSPANARGERHGDPVRRLDMVSIELKELTQRSCSQTGTDDDDWRHW